MRLPAVPLLCFSCRTHHMSWPTMSNKGTVAQHCLTYKEMVEIVEMICWALETSGPVVKPPAPVHFPYLSYHSTGDHSTWCPSIYSIRKHALYLYKTYNQPARPGEFIFKELLLNKRKRLFLRIVHRHAPHVTIEVLDFLIGSDLTKSCTRCVRTNKTYLMGAGFVDIGLEGRWEHLAFGLWRLWNPMTTLGRRAMVTFKALQVGIWYKVLDCYYGYKPEDEEHYATELASQTVNWLY